MVPDIDVAKQSEKIQTFIKKTFSQAGFSNAVIALSGGVDSSTSFAVTVAALGPDNVYPVLLPYGLLSTEGTLDAMNIITAKNIPIGHITRIDIRSIVDAIVYKEPGIDNIRKGNIMARIRMTLIYDQAKRRNALVVGTENKSEHLLGYYTRFGDEASDIEPIRYLYKTQVYALAKHLGVPEQILIKKPTAGLWEGQSDEDELGFSYKDADEILYRYFELGKPKEEILKSGIAADTIEKVLAFVAKNDFKHHLPLVIPDNEGKV